MNRFDKTSVLALGLTLGNFLVWQSGLVIFGVSCLYGLTVLAIILEDRAH